MNQADSAKNSCIIFVFHGSKDPNAGSKAVEMVSKMGIKEKSDVRFGFLMHQEPIVTSVIREAAENGYALIRIVPLLILPGFHVRTDLPSLLEEMTRKFKNVRFELMPSLAEDEDFIAWLSSKTVKLREKEGQDDL